RSAATCHRWPARCRAAPQRRPATTTTSRSRWRPWCGETIPTSSARWRCQRRPVAHPWTPRWLSRTTGVHRAPLTSALSARPGIVSPETCVAPPAGQRRSPMRLTWRRPQRPAAGGLRPTRRPAAPDARLCALSHFAGRRTRRDEALAVVPAPRAVRGARGDAAEEGWVSLTAKDRFRIMWRDHFTCLYCGAKPPNVALQIDHFVPVSRGGSDADFNLITACVSCNQGKSDFPANYSCTGCVRPMCGGPEYSRDWA